MLKDKFLIGILALTAIVGIMMGLSAMPGKNAPAVNKGVLDLSGWNPGESGNISLDGQWEFFPNQLLVPGESGGLLTKRQYLLVPGKWDGQPDGKGGTMKGHGYGTYRLLIRNAPADRMLALSKHYARFSDKLYVDRALAGESGKTGTTREQYVPRNEPYTVFFRAGSDEVEVLLQVANFDYKNGGISDSLYFGLGKEMETRKSFQTGLELMGTFFFLFFALLFVFLYVGFHRNSFFLLFGTFFFFFAISVITNGERLFLQFLPDIPFEWAFKIKNVSVFLTPALLFFMTWKWFKAAAVRHLFLFTAAALFLYCVAIAILPFRVYSALLDAVYLGFTLICAILAVFLLMSYVSGRFGSLDKRQLQMHFSAVWSTLLTAIIAILNSENVIPMELANTTVLLFLFFISLLLIHQYAGAYSAMRKLTNQLQAMDRMKDEFLLITSHELNTPLHGIINLSQSLLKTPLRKAAEDGMKEKLQTIRNTAYRMSNMVKDIIDVARIKDGKMEVTVGKMDLATCISVVIEVFDFLAKGKNTVLDHQIAPDARFVMADENRLMQVLYNAISHSLQQGQDGVVTIGSNRRDQSVVMTIRNSAVLGKATDNNAAEQAGDNGFSVGMSIVHELMELMGGTFESRDDREIELVLPAAWEGGIGEAEAAAASEALPAKIGAKDEGAKAEASKIMIASADPVDVEHLYGMLSMEGFDVVCAGSDKEVFSHITRMDRPDLVLLDVRLPDLNGYELCRRIRRHFTQMELPVLFISARMTPADIEAGIAAGGSDFIARPLDAGEIRVRVNTLMSMKRLVKEATVNEMAFLRSQIKPHFLYNALGTIMSLCYTDGARAGELLSTFSRYLRIIFHMDNTEETVKLSKEMELIQAYVDIEKERFGERVRVEFDVDDQLYGCQVMPLTIEPLVENAIRHGVSKKVSGGTVRLTIRKQGGFVQVVVEDDGVGMTEVQVQSILDSSGKQEQGVGFRNIMRRVAHLTGKQPVVESERGKGTKVTIWLPLSYS
ncbi:histidine kinase [Cohnella silvisoli]|uniref:histidine kinase n=1 Tax=Cohnella silvisoli TaxID=2873699 RepID=A0ABV1L2E3_9BACL|nr:histidine kinase [Cohnella silvisoli]MCD9025804.1 histidine kinase [Cohnella silvisoli]